MNANLSLWDWLGQIPDPRNSSGRRYSLQSILALITVGLLNGQTSLRSISRWGRKLSRCQLELFGIRRRKSPSQTTMHYLLVRLDPRDLEHALASWLKGLAAKSLPERPSLSSLEGLTEEYRVLHVLAAYCATVSRHVGRAREDFRGVDLTGKIEDLREILRRIPLPA